MEDVRPAIAGVVAVAILVFVMFVYSLVVTPPRMHEAQRQATINAQNVATQAEEKFAGAAGEFERTRARNIELTNQLPLPDITDEQETVITRLLEPLGPHTVSIKYLDTPTSRASGYA